jgi:hypothetical protein
LENQEKIPEESPSYEWLGRGLLLLYVLMLGFALVLALIQYNIRLSLDNAISLCLRDTACFGSQNSPSVLSNLQTANLWETVGIGAIVTGLVAGGVAGIVGLRKITIKESERLER